MLDKQNHNLCIVDSNLSYQPIFAKIKQKLSEGYAVIFAAESSPTQIITQMAKTGIDVEDNVENGRLLVLDKKSAYLLKTKLNGQNVLDPWYSLVSSKAKERNSIKGLLVVVTNEEQLISHQRDDYQKHIAFEQMVGRNPQFEKPVEVICCYTEKAISDLPLKYLITILNCHQSTAHSTGTAKEWYSGDIIKLLNRGIDEALGIEAGKLVFQTLKLVYKINEDDILAQPERFEDTIGKILGNGAAIALDIISEEIKKEIRFYNNK